MRRTALVIFLVGGFLASPLFCDVGLVDHECVCDSSECCPEEVACEQDTCDDIFKTEGWREKYASLHAAAILPEMPARSNLPAHDVTLTPSRRTRSNQPFPTSDVPLRI